METEKSYVEVSHVSKAFKKQPILRDVSLSLEKGRITGLVGPNGSGKTVLMKIICGLMYADNGTVFVNQKQIGREIDFPESLGALIETPGFISYMSGYENLQGLAELKRVIGPGEIKESIRRLGLNPAERKKVGKYSLGMRQRLGIAQAIMEDPELLILDEPMNGLDRDGVLTVRQLLLNLKKEGKCILLASHNVEDIRILCDEVYEIQEGTVAPLEETE